MMVRFYSYFFLFSFSFSFYASADSENNLLNNDIWETKEVQAGQHELDLNQKYQSDWSSLKNENLSPKIDTVTERNGLKRKWASVLTFDRLKNLTEKDKGPGNNSKVIFINSEDHLRIYENDNDDEDETGIQDRDEQRFSLLSAEAFLSQIHSSEEKSLERSKRQAEGGKKKCRCRRKRRGVRRRRRRRRRRGRRTRVGQTEQGRQRRRGRRRGAGRRRRGRRRCVCRRKEAGEGGEGEEGEGDEGDGEEETTTTEGGEEESDNEEEGEEGGEYGDEDGDEDGDEEMEDGEEGEDEEGDKSKEEEENEDYEEDESMGSMYPGTSGTYGGAPNAVGTPAYATLPVPFSPYPYYPRSPSTLQAANHRSSKM